MSNKVDNLFNTAVNLADLISQPTETKNPGVVETVSNIVDNNDFTAPLQKPPVEIEKPEPSEPYDAEQEAKNLVHMLKAGEGLLLPPIALYSFNKKRGGKKAIERMSKAHEKRSKGGELNDYETKSADSFDKYQADFKKMMGLFYPEDDYLREMMEADTQKLIEAAIPYCEATQFHVNAGFAFWTMYAGGLGGKIIQILGA